MAVTFYWDGESGACTYEHRRALFDQKPPVIDVEFDRISYSDFDGVASKVLRGSVYELTSTEVSKLRGYANTHAQETAMGDTSVVRTTPTVYSQEQINTVKRDLHIKELAPNEYVASVNGKFGNVTGIATDVSVDEKLKHITGVPIGSIFLAPFTTSWTPEGAVLCDGTEYRADQFDQFWNNFLITNRVMTCTYGQYQIDVMNSGGCAKFAIDTSKRTFKVPTIGNGTFVQGGDGTAYEAGLPNIKGTLPGSWAQSDHVTGAFVEEFKQGVYQGLQDAYKDCNWFDFNASRSSPIYGKSTTVQPKSVSMRFYVQLANGSVNQSQMDWARYMEGLNGKANKSDVDRVKAYITETWHSGANWYRVWSDGFIEQGGTLIGKQSTQAVITFHKPFKNLNYQFWVLGNQLGGNDTAGKGECDFATNMTNAHVKVSLQNAMDHVDWHACSY